MKLHLSLCLAMLLLFSACGETSAVSVSQSSQTPVMVSPDQVLVSDAISAVSSETSERALISSLAKIILPEYVPLEKLPKNYTTEEALDDGVVVLVHGEYEGPNYHLIPVFLRQISEGKAAKLRIKEYTIEGDPLYRDLEYLPEEHCYQITFDSTRDEFAAKKTIYSKKYAWLWIQPPKNEDPEYDNPNTYLALSCWKTVDAVPEGQYPFTLLPIPEDIMENTLSLVDQLSCDCLDIQRVFDPNSSLEARLSPNGNVTIVNGDDVWNVENINFSFEYLEWDNSLLLFMDGENTVQTYHPTEKAFLCTGVPLVKQS